MGLCGFATSVFTDTGENLGSSAAALAENRRLFDSAPVWARVAAPLVVAHFRLRRLVHGHYSRAPLDYEIYTLESPGKRVRFKVERSTGVWKLRR
jgi:hypothetical protein